MSRSAPAKMGAPGSPVQPGASTSRLVRPDGGRVSALEVDAVEVMATEWIDLEAHHLVAHRLEYHRVGDRDPGRLFLEDDLRLLVQPGALGLVGGALGLDQQLVERFMAPAGPVRAVLGGIA